jgi:hypothetical protein
VAATLVEDASAKDALLKKLIGDHEPPYAEQWRGLGTEFANKMLAGIVGFELKVVDLQCKLKLNQHRPESHAALRGFMPKAMTMSASWRAGWTRSAWAMHTTSGEGAHENRVRGIEPAGRRGDRGHPG